MKKFLLFFAAIVALVFCIHYSTRTEAHGLLVSPNIVISQLYGSGGAPAAPFNHDFVELFNRGAAPVNISGWSFQYASASGSNWLVTNLPNATIQPGQYFLIQFDTENTAVGGALPTPDYIAPLVNGNTFILNMSRTSAKVALVNSTTQLPASTCPSDPSIVDMLGYGNDASCSEGTRTADLSITTAAIRGGGGCTDTDNNVLNFAISAPVPRNSLSPTNTCSLGGQLQAGMGASPNILAPGNNTLLTVTVIPATTPPSTGITVTGNLSSIGGLASQGFFDDGTHGDVTSGDNVFSFSTAIPVGTSNGTYNVTATASDAQARNAPTNVTITVSGVQPDEDPLILGNPSGATADIANENNYLMVKPQYTLSYNRSHNEPNWVAWRLDTSWIGSTPRQDDYRPDTTLPAGWYEVTPTDYSEPIYDRGHMCPSADRTNSVANNSATFLMTNFVPQLPQNNQGPWEDFESYTRTLATAGNEVYIIDGPQGNLGTIGNGVVIPNVTWKVVLVLPNGSDDLHRITKATRAFGIIVPNHLPLDINAPWRNFRTTVDAVETLTGYDFFSNVPINTQAMIERRRDTQ